MVFNILALDIVSNVYALLYCCINPYSLNEYLFQIANYFEIVDDECCHTICLSLETEVYEKS